MTCAARSQRAKSRRRSAFGSPRQATDFVSSEPSVASPVCQSFQWFTPSEVRSPQRWPCYHGVMSANDENPTQVPAQPTKRRWPKLHASTVVVLAFMAVALLLANIYGQRDMTLAYDNGLDTEETFKHGWPESFIEREVLVGEFGVPPMPRYRSRWLFLQEVQPFTALALLANFAVGIIVLVVVGCLFENWRRGRARVFQLHLIDLFLLSGVVASGFGFYVYHRSRHQAEIAALQAIDAIERPEWMDYSCESPADWQPVALPWFELDGESARVLDRIVRVDASPASLKEVVKLRELRVARLTMTTLESADQLAVLEELPHLEALLLSDSFLDVPFERPRRVFNVPRLSRLRGLSCAWTQYDGDGLENLPSLEFLDLEGTDIANTALVPIGAMSQLRVLNLGATRITDDGLRHLVGLPHLQELHLGSTEITDNGVRHLAALRDLRSLHLEENNMTDDCVPMFVQLVELEYLNLMDTKVTEQAKEGLRRALPDCQIH